MRLSTSAAFVAAVAWMLVAPGTGAGAYVIHDRTWLISTAAGGVGGPGSGRQIPVEPCAVAPAAGGLYIADQILTTAAGTSAPAGPVIREVSQRTGALTTPLGDGGPGASADGTNGSQADLAVGCGLVLDHSGNLLFSQTTFQGTAPTVQLPVERIRVLAARSGRFYGKAMRAGRIYTIAGNGKIGFGGDGGPALKAALSTPGGLAVDAAGSVYIEDTGNLRLRIIARKTGRFFGQAMKAGDIYTIAGDGQFGFSGDGVLATRTAMGLLDPSVAAEPTGQAVAIDRFGNAVVADVANNRIRVIAATSGRFYGQAMKAGFIYTVAGDGQDGATGASYGCRDESPARAGDRPVRQHPYRAGSPLPGAGRRG